MKRLKFAVIILLILSLTGCIKEYKVTDEQSNAIAEYAAGAVLKHDRNYDQELISSDSAQEDASPVTVVTVAPTKVPDLGTPSVMPGNVTGEPSDVTGAPVDNGTLTEVIGASGFEINYKSYKLADSYGGDKYFELSPRENCKLMVVTFDIKNTSSEKLTFNMLKEDGMQYLLYNNSDTDYTTPLLTFLENDLKYMKMDFNAGKTKKGLLIFEVPNNMKPSNMKLIVKNNDKSCTIILN